MKNAAWIAVLIIILVCINWVSDGFTQPTPEQIKAYEDMIKAGSQQVTATTGVYQSPPIYDQNEQGVNDSLLIHHRRQSERKQLPLSPDIGTAQIATIPDTGQLVLPPGAGIDRFGHNLFAGTPVNEINTSLIPEGYLLGPGDNIIINLWGRVQQEWNLTVDRQGKIFIPKVGEIAAWGLTLDQFAERLDASLNKVYSGYERRVTLGKIRTIRVFVYGEVAAPGGYAVSALSTLFNALYMAGGPTAGGSLRNIRLIRDQQARTVDLYDFLVSGDKSCDLPLLSGDVVFVPLVGPQATVRGEVKRPAVYELAGGETLADLVSLAGGPTADAYLGRMMLDRIGPDDARRVVDLDYTDTLTHSLALADGDDLSVFSIYQMRQNIVWISGMVKHPGTFERGDGMRVADLVDKGQLLPNKVYRQRADLYRHHPDGNTEIIAVNLESLANDTVSGNLVLQNLDSLHIYSTDDVERKKYVYIDGMVRNPGQYPLYDRMTVSDLIFLAGNLKESASMLNAELARIDSSGITDVISVRLDQRELGLGLPLQENDHLFVRQMPGYQLHRVVTIEGEIRFPGDYSLTRKRETFWQLLNRAGGFTDKAFPVGTVIRRPSISDALQLKDIDHILKNSQPLLADSSGTLKPYQVMDIDPESTDRIIIDMVRLVGSGGRDGDFALQPGDHIYVPEIPTGISVLGEVGANGTIRFRPDKKVKQYIRQAGGFTKRADCDQTRLIKADGRVFASGVINRKVDLGDVIVVPAEIKKEKDWLKYITAGLSILTGVATSVLVIDRL